LIATSRARLLLAVAADDAAESERLRQTTFDALRSVVGDDPRVLALQASALIESGHADQAAPAVERLRQAGYRDPSLLNLLAREHIAYPPSPDVESRLQAALQRAPSNK
jgi:hypothetical protein